MTTRLQTTGILGAGRPSSTPTYVLEYLISELADGVTPSPQFEVASSDVGLPQDDNEQIHTFSVARLGLIDLSLSGILPAELAAAPSGLGQRYVVWAWGRDFVLGDASPLQSANTVEGEGYVNVEPLETLPLGAKTFYSKKGYIMPHGTVLRVANMAPEVAGVPFLLRIGVIVPPSVRDDAAMREALCCTESIVTETDSTASCLAANFLTPNVSPNQLTGGPTPQQIVIKASPVSPGFTTVTVTAPSAGPITPTNLEIVFPDTIRFTGVFTEVGSYTVALSNGSGCDTTLNNAFTVG